MSRLEEVVDIYEKADNATEILLKGSGENKEMQKILALVNISQSLRNIDITLAMLLDDKRRQGQELDKGGE